MDIEEDTPRRLVLADPRRRVAAGIILAIAAAWLFLGTPLAAEQNGPIVGLIAAAFTALPVAWGLLMLRQSRATFDADRAIVHVRRALLPDPKGWTVPFDEIEELYLDLCGNQDGGPPGFQPFMMTRTGAVQLTMSVYNRETADAALDAAERFLADAGVPVRRAAKPKRWGAMRYRPQDA